MKALMLFASVLPLVGCMCRQTFSNHNIVGETWLWVHDLGGSAPDAPAGGPILAVWSDGIVAMSPMFPRHSPSFQLARLDSRSMRAMHERLQRLATEIPEQVAFAADEWTARAYFRNRDDRSMPAWSQRDVPACFLTGDCPGRLGTAEVTWGDIMRDLRRSVESAIIDDDPDALRRAEELWRRGSP